MAFGVHVHFDGAREQRTPVAMGMRTFAWITIAIFAWRLLRPQTPDDGAE